MDTYSRFSRRLSQWILLTTFLGAGSAVAGTASSGGGGAFLCPGAIPGSAPTSHLLELWEEEVIRQNPIAWSQDEYLVQVDRALGLLDRSNALFAREVRQAFAVVQAGFEILPAGVGLPAPPDAQPEFIKEGCTFEGMLYFDGPRQKVLARARTYDALATRTDRAAAHLHEAVYLALRDRFLHGTSNVARRIVGCVFSVEPEKCLGIQSAPSLGAPYLRCIGADSEFFMKATGVMDAWGDELHSVEVRKMAGWFFGTPMSMLTPIRSSPAGCSLGDELLPAGQSWATELGKEPYNLGIGHFWWSPTAGGVDCARSLLTQEISGALSPFYGVTHPANLPVLPTQSLRCVRVD